MDLIVVYQSESQAAYAAGAIENGAGPEFAGPAEAGWYFYGDDEPEIWSGPFLSMRGAFDAACGEAAKTGAVVKLRTGDAHGMVKIVGHANRGEVAS